MDIERNPFLAPLRFFRLPFRKQVFYILMVIYAVCVMMVVPSGWIYDLGLKEGTEQGQKPDHTVQIIQTQDEVENFYFQKVPATVSKNGLIRCPLMHLRDVRQAGEYMGTNKIEHEITEYLSMSYPIDRMDNMLDSLMQSTYNTYYLAPLEDGTYVCVYFDDYLLLSSGEELHTGYVRDTSTEEKIMLRGMEKDYEVNPVYVLDMYRYGKFNWIVDGIGRFIIAVLVPLIVSALLKGPKKEEKKLSREAVKIAKEKARFAIREHENVIGSAQIYNMYAGMNGTIYVTNQRVCFVGNLTAYMYMNLPLSEVAGYETWRILLTRYIAVHDRDNPTDMRYQYTGIAVKKLQSWLEQAGIWELER